MKNNKKAYVSPKLVKQGSIEDLTQGTLTLGSGDLIFTLTNNQTGEPIVLAVS